MQMPDDHDLFPMTDQQGSSPLAGHSVELQHMEGRPFCCVTEPCLGIASGAIQLLASWVGSSFVVIMEL